MAPRLLSRRRNRLSQGSLLPKALLKSIQRGTMAYTYKGVPTLKNPFDWALYPMLLWEARPRTIIEIGSNQGGSALWMADVMRGFALPCHIHSVDIAPVTGVEAAGVTFHRGDARDLTHALDGDFMRGLARPLLVIEDADHQAATTLAVLQFFDAWLSPGEYILIEDGILTDMGPVKAFSGGPRRALEQFLAERGSDYVVDTRYCDWFGRNVTWNVNGFLRRLK
jgi:cephalosporin hydroxylase